MRRFVKIEIEAFAEEAEILIAELSEIKFYAFEQQEDLLMAFVNEEDFDEERVKEVLPKGKDFKKSVLKEENWNQQWESGFQPVVINDFVAIRAAFHKPVKNVSHELIITPKMSFGTGHHATTSLMIQLMEKTDFQDKKVIDYGTGTGVLAILAEKSGAAEVIAIDNDNWSIMNVLENTEANLCKKIFVEKRDGLSGLPPVDILLANINLNVLTQSASAISSVLPSGSLLLISGFLHIDEQVIENVFVREQFFKLHLLRKDEWLAMSFQKR